MRIWLIRWLIKILLQGYHLRKNPVRKRVIKNEPIYSIDKM